MSSPTRDAVAAERVRGENDCCFIRIKFTDTGVGIKRENLDRIFDPFFTTKPEGQGTGMGLAIIHALIEKMGGTIAVESEEGMGAIFTIDLPGETGAPVSGNQTNGEKA
jgi:signal transduction histidine kinase